MSDTRLAARVQGLVAAVHRSLGRPTQYEAARGSTARRWSRRSTSLSPWRRALLPRPLGLRTKNGSPRSPTSTRCSVRALREGATNAPRCGNPAASTPPSASIEPAPRATAGRSCRSGRSPEAAGSTSGTPGHGRTRASSASSVRPAFGTAGSARSTSARFRGVVLLRPGAARVAWPARGGNCALPLWTRASSTRRGTGALRPAGVAACISMSTGACWLSFATTAAGTRGSDPAIGTDAERRQQRFASWYGAFEGDLVEDVVDPGRLPAPRVRTPESA